MTLNDVNFKPWRNGSKDSSTGYGFCISKKYRNLFPRNWSNIIVLICYGNESELIVFNLKDTFWSTCPDLKNNSVRKWFEASGILRWSGRKPELRTTYLGENKFKVDL